MRLYSVSIFVEFLGKLKHLIIRHFGVRTNTNIAQRVPTPMPSRIRQANGDDYPQAAMKHLEDAKSLLGANRVDGAAYLAGYVVECSLKSLVIVARGNPRQFSHNLTGLSQHTLALAAQLGSTTARYAPRISPSPSICDGRPNGWHEGIRYFEAGAVTAVTAAAWLREAEAIYTSTIVPMRIDGLV